MDPITMAAIFGGSQLLGNLMTGGAQRSAEKRQVAAEGAKGVYDLTQSQIAQSQQAKQGSLQDLIAAYRSTLGRK
jgi:hypothetical protein